MKNYRERAETKPWEPCPDFTGSQGVPPGGLCECPGSHFPCLGAGLGSLHPWWALAQHSLWEHSKEKSQPLGKGSCHEHLCLKPQVLQAQSRGDRRLPAWTPPSLLSPAQGAPTASGGPEESWLPPVFSQLFAPVSCNCLASAHAFEWKRV